MPVPSSIQSLLKAQNINFSVTPSAEANPLWHDRHLRSIGAAKSVILQDEEGRVQVVIPAASMLDLNSLNRHLGRDLRATNPADLQKFFSKHGLQSVPALPKIAELPIIVDSRLMKAETLILDSGVCDELITIKGSDFKQLVTESEVADIAIPLSDLEAPDTSASNEEQIFDSVRNFTSLRIKQRLEETLELPPLSETAQKIIKLRVDPEADISDLANIVETDPSLAAQVVSWAASPYYSAPGKIKSIHDAIVRVLGFDMVLNLALGLALGKTLNLPKDGPQGSTPYWKQSVYTAAMVEGLITAIPREHRPGFGMAYLSGLLHNFGYLVLSEVFPPHFSTICRYIEVNPHVPRHMIERHILGITSEQLSSWLMDLWHMPAEVVVALQHQSHAEFTGEYCEYAKLINVSQSLLAKNGLGNAALEEIPPELYKELNLDPEKAQATVENILESSLELDNIAAQLAPT